MFLHHFKLILLSSLLTSFTFCGYSQMVILQNNMGTPFFETNNSNYKGTPFMFTTWLDATVFTSSNQEKGFNIKVNYHISSGKLLYLDKEKLMEFSMPIHSCIIKNADKEIQLIHARNFNQTQLFYFQLLYKNDNVFFLKKSLKIMVEQSIYGSPDKNYSYEDGKEYYIYYNGELLKVKLNKESLINVAQLIHKNSNKIKNYKSEEDWIAFLKSE